MVFKTFWVCLCPRLFSYHGHRCGGMGGGEAVYLLSDTGLIFCSAAIQHMALSTILIPSWTQIIYLSPDTSTVSFHVSSMPWNRPMIRPGYMSPKDRWRQAVGMPARIAVYRQGSDEDLALSCFLFSFSFKSCESTFIFCLFVPHKAFSLQTTKPMWPLVT